MGRTVKGERGWAMNALTNQRQECEFVGEMYTGPKFNFPRGELMVPVRFDMGKEYSYQDCPVDFTSLATQPKSPEKLWVYRCKFQVALSFKRDPDEWAMWKHDPPDGGLPMCPWATPTCHSPCDVANDRSNTSRFRMLGIPEEPVDDRPLE